MFDGILYLILATQMAISAFERDETLRGYGGAGKEWHLTSLRDAPFQAKATLRFPRRGEVVGTGPCNRFFSTNTVPYPWFAAGPVASTRHSCPDLAHETEFFTALGAATLSEILGNTLILSNDTGVLLVFKATD